MNLNISRAELRIGQQKMSDAKSISFRVLCLIQKRVERNLPATYANSLAVRVGKLLRIARSRKPS